MNIDQLNALSDFELRVAVGEKRGFNVSCLVAGERVQIPTREGLISYDPVTNPAQYMPIAIEHGISCITSKGLDSLWAKCEEENEVSPVYPLHSDFMGRAVCTVFLLMNGDSND